MPCEVANGPPEFVPAHLKSSDDPDSGKQVPSWYVLQNGGHLIVGLAKGLPLVALCKSAALPLLDPLKRYDMLMLRVSRFSEIFP